MAVCTRLGLGAGEQLARKEAQRLAAHCLGLAQQHRVKRRKVGRRHRLRAGDARVRQPTNKAAQGAAERERVVGGESLGHRRELALL